MTINTRTCREGGRRNPFYDDVLSRLCSSPDNRLTLELASIPGATNASKCNRIVGNLFSRGIHVRTRTDATYMYVSLRSEEGAR